MVKRLRLHKNPSCPKRIYSDTERKRERESDREGERWVWQKGSLGSSDLTVNFILHQTTVQSELPFFPRF